MSSDVLHYRHDRAIGGEFVEGAPADWSWSKEGGSPAKGRDFFWVHWQVNLQPDAGVVRLHVESPARTKDPLLNELKQDVIEALLASSIEQVLRQKGFKYKVGARVSTGEIERNKSTEAFRVILSDRQRKSTPEKNIRRVHTAVGSAVAEVLQSFVGKLNLHFL